MSREPDTPSLRLEIWNGETTTTVRLFGEFDDDSAEAAEKVLVPLCSDEDARELLVDLRGLTFIDSTGIEVLLELEEAVERSGRRYGVIRGPRIVQRLLKLAGVEDRLSFLGGAGR